MGKSKKGGLLTRRKNALKSLEVAYEKFKAAGVDKESSHGSKPGRPYDQECRRMAQEIETLKKRTLV